jgi:hypothetical protein
VPCFVYRLLRPDDYRLDVSLVPTNDLPLQTILQFQPCPEAPATSYLQAMCMAEGHLIEPETLLQVYKRTYIPLSVDMPDEPMNPRTEKLPSQDLRKAIHHIQLCCSLGCNLFQPTTSLRNTSESETDTSKTNIQEQPYLLTTLQQHTDRVSFMNSYLLRSPLDTPEVS